EQPVLRHAVCGVVLVLDAPVVVRRARREHLGYEVGRGEVHLVRREGGGPLGGEEADVRLVVVPRQREHHLLEADPAEPVELDVGAEQLEQAPGGILVAFLGGRVHDDLSVDELGLLALGDLGVEAEAALALLGQRGLHALEVERRGGRIEEALDERFHDTGGVVLGATRGAAAGSRATAAGARGGATRRATPRTGPPRWPRASGASATCRRRGSGSRRSP